MVCVQKNKFTSLACCCSDVNLCVTAFFYLASLPKLPATSVTSFILVSSPLPHVNKIYGTFKCILK